MSLKVTIYHADCRAEWSTPWLNAIGKGFLRHGVNVKLSSYSGARHGINCDLAVFWSHRPKHIIEHQRENGLDYLVIERGYIGDRMKFSSVGFNGLNNRGEYHTLNMPADRWQKYFSGMMKPWNENGEHILLIGQVEGDESIKGRVVMKKWLKETATELNELYPDMEIVSRQHPKSRHLYSIPGTVKDTGSLEDALAGAKFCVTFNSNAGVDAILAGVPTVAMDRGAMAYGITSHELDEPIFKPHRMQWAYDMTYKQWTVEEVASGEAWEHLKRRYV